MAQATDTPGRISDMDFDLAALQDRVGVTAGVKPRNASRTLFPQEASAEPVEG